MIIGDHGRKLIGRKVKPAELRTMTSLNVIPLNVTPLNVTPLNVNRVISVADAVGPSVMIISHLKCVKVC